MRRIVRKAVKPRRNRRFSAGLYGGHTSTYAGVRSNYTQFQMKNKAFALPRTVTRDLQYTDIIAAFSTANTANTGSERLYSLNSVFDPDITGVGHQPYGYDQIQNQYHKYRVYAVTVKALYLHPSTATIYGLARIQSSQDTSTLTIVDWARAAEQTGVWNSNVPMEGSGTATFTGTFNIWDIEGMTYEQWVADDGYEANVGANPAANTKLSLAVGDIAAPVGQQNCRILITLIYHVEFSNPVIQTQS